MDTITYDLMKKEHDQKLDRFLEIETELLSHIESLYTLLEERQPLAQTLNLENRHLRNSPENKDAGVRKFQILVLGATFGEVVKAWMDRYVDRKKGGYDMSYERLISNRPEPREKPGKIYSVNGQEIKVTGPRKLRLPGGNK